MLPPAAPDHDAELQLPIGFGGGRWQHQIVERADDRRRRLEERVRHAVGGALVHHLFGPAAELVAAQPFRPDVLVDRELDHVLAVVGPGEEQLAGNVDRGMHPQVGHRHALVERRGVSGTVQGGEVRVPVLQQREHRRRSVEPHDSIITNKARKPDPVVRREGTERKGHAGIARTGRRARPCSVLLSIHSGSAVSSNRSTRSASSAKIACPSILARLWPTHRWIPRPNAS